MDNYPRWIPITEAEPPKGVWVIVSTGKFVTMAKKYNQVFRNGSCITSWRTNGGGINDIKAWMMPPELWRDDEQAKDS